MYIFCIWAVWWAYTGKMLRNNLRPLLILADEVYSTLGLTTTVYVAMPWTEGKKNWLVVMY